MHFSKFYLHLAGLLHFLHLLVGRGPSMLVNLNLLILRRSKLIFPARKMIMSSTDINIEAS